jgi:hypothetical protein
MNNLQRLIIGYIPENCKLEYIDPGHYKLTNETFIELKDKKFYTIRLNYGYKELPISYDDLWDPSSKMWELFVDKFCNQLSNGVSSLNPITLGKSWSFFNLEGDIPEGSFVVKNDMETLGELENKKEYCDGNHWYIRYLHLDIDKDGFDKEIYDDIWILINSKIKRYKTNEI